jgi:hypothetical protein
MPNLYPELGVGKADSDKMTGPVPVSEALTGDKREVLAFVVNVRDTAFEVTDPRKAGTLYKFVLTMISGEPRVAITHRNPENWEELKAFLRNRYREKTTLDYHAIQLFSSRHSKSESVSDWTQKIQRLRPEFREAALHDCEPDERVGTWTITGKLRNLYFVQGLYSNFDESAETALEEESVLLVSKLKRYKGWSTQLNGTKCSNRGKVGHVATECYLKEKKDV